MLIDNSNKSNYNGCIILDQESGKLLYSSLPKDMLGEYAGSNYTTNEFLMHILASKMINLEHKGKIDEFKFMERKYFLSAYLMPSAGWAVMQIINVGELPKYSGESRYFVIAVGMLMLLLGIRDAVAVAA